MCTHSVIIDRFAGTAQVSKVVRSAKNVAYFGHRFEWPVARPVDSEEYLLVEVFNHNKYMSNKYDVMTVSDTLSRHGLDIYTSTFISSQVSWSCSVESAGSYC